MGKMYVERDRGYCWFCIKIKFIKFEFCIEEDISDRRGLEE